MKTTSLLPIAYPLPGTEEREAVLRGLAAGHLAQRKLVASFARRFAELCQLQEAVAVSSGTTAQNITLPAQDIETGDEVITAPFNFAATANVILLVGTTLVVGHLDPQTYNQNPANVQSGKCQ